MTHPSQPILLAVPNISEGRDQAKIARIAGADALLDIHSDPDHNRSVITYGGAPDVVADACYAMVERAVVELDITEHSGAHPRYGVVDVLPFVPYHATASDVDRVATEMIWRIGQGPGIPVYTYGRLSPDMRSLPDLRRLLRETRPPAHPTAGVICLSIRDPLVAFNVNVSGAVEGARRVCASLRDLPGVRALAFVLPSRDLVQISTNLTALDQTGPAKAFARTAELSAPEHLEVVEAEIVGLVPQSVVSELDRIPLVRPARSIEQALAG